VPPVCGSVTAPRRLPDWGVGAPANPPPAAGERVARPPIPAGAARDGARHSSTMTRIRSVLVKARVLSGHEGAGGPTLEYRGRVDAIKLGGAGYVSETVRARRAFAGRPPAASRCVARAGAVAIVALLQTAGATALEISGDHRLFRRFIEDGAIVQKAWYEAAAQYDDFEGGHDLSGTITAAFRLGMDVEAGIKAGIIDRRRDAGEVLYGAALPRGVDTIGLADATLYGKYRILRSPIELAVGAAAFLPLADSSRGLGPGAFRYEAFVGVRKNFPGAALVGSLGTTDRSDSGAAGRSPGRSAPSFGTGVLVPLSSFWTVLGEVTYDGSRYEGDRADSRVLAGLDWRPTANLVVRGSLGHGLSDRSPARTATLSGAFHF